MPARRRPPDALAVARSLASALDADDYAAAARLLAPGCRYVVRGRVLTGPGAVLESYRAASLWAGSALDEVRYESAVVPRGPDGATILYTDHVGVRGRRLAHRSRQDVVVGADGRIVRIEHHDLPGERWRLRVFLRAAGVTRPDGPGA